MNCLVYASKLKYQIHVIPSLVKNYLRSPDVCILDAVLTVSPNKQYRGILLPTTPATHGPKTVE